MINSAPVMLFMKGDPEQPRCGQYQDSSVSITYCLKYACLKKIKSSRLTRVVKNLLLYCTGFSRQITQLLKEQGIKFSSFDILQDEEVRQG